MVDVADVPAGSGLPADEDAVRSAVTATLDRFALGGPGRGQPGVAWGVVADGRLALSGGYGALRYGADGAPAGPVPDADSVFRIASMTKSFTAATVVALRDAGRLGLDDPVARYVPELAGLALPTKDSPGLTVRHLLTMSGGLPTDDPWGDRQQALDPDAFGAFLRGGLTFAWVPGTTFEYANLGYAILGRAVASAAGEDYADAVRHLLLDPLGLASTRYREEEVDAARLATGYRPTPTAATGGAPDGARRTWEQEPSDAYGTFAAMGGLFSTVRDLSAWVAGFLDAFPPRDDAEGGHPLSRASRREMQQQHRAIPPRVLAPAVDAPAVLRAGGYGYGLVAEHDPRRGLLVSHSGGYPGFGSHMRWHPDSGLGVVVLASGTYAASPTAAAQVLGLLLDLRDRADGGVNGSVEAPSAVRSPLRPAAAAPGLPWPATLAAVDTVERLVADGWDDDVVARLVAENVDLDEPMTVRRERFAQAAGLAGASGLVRDGSVEHDSPAHATWWLRGAGGRVRLEIRLTPHPEPLVQTLTVVPVPDPSPALANVLVQVATVLRTDGPAWPRNISTAPGFDVAGATRRLRVAAAFAGPCTLGEVLTGDGTRTVSVRVHGERAELELGVELDDDLRVRRLVLGHPEQGRASTD